MENLQDKAQTAKIHWMIRFTPCRLLALAAVPCIIYSLVAVGITDGRSLIALPFFLISCLYLLLTDWIVKLVTGREIRPVWIIETVIIIVTAVVVTMLLQKPVFT